MNALGPVLPKSGLSCAMKPQKCRSADRWALRAVERPYFAGTLVPLRIVPAYHDQVNNLNEHRLAMLV
jgi:hypothetical protein